MRLKKSPGGSLFPYYYKGGELHCLKYGSFHSNSDALFALMKEEEQFIFGTNRRLNIWVDFYETNLSDLVMIKFVENIQHLHNHMNRLAIVGLSFWDRWRLRQMIKKMIHPFPEWIQYFSDPEAAKTWLIND